MALHEFRVRSEWRGGRNGEGTLSAENLQTNIAIPAKLNGPGTGTNPEELLIGAALTCYIITLAIMIEKRQIPLESLTQESVGVISKDRNGQTFESIIHKPCIVLGAGATEEDVARVERLVELAEKSCMISSALRGNVTLSVDATVTIGS